MPRQDEIFLTEGDRWFARNQAVINAQTEDRIASYVAAHKMGKKAVLEIGCSNGWRLNLLGAVCSGELHGIEPGAAAVADGAARSPELKLERGVAHDLSPYEAGRFDLVIVSFVFHWLDREKLLQSVSEIDRVLAESGHLIIQDFDPGYPCKTRYHHLPEQEVYTYKQRYWDLFTASNLYGLVHEEQFLHDPAHDTLDNNNWCKFVVLQKRPRANYPLITL